MLIFRNFAKCENIIQENSEYSVEQLEGLIKDEILTYLKLIMASNDDELNSILLIHGVDDDNNNKNIKETSSDTSTVNKIENLTPNLETSSKNLAILENEKDKETDLKLSTTFETRNLSDSPSPRNYRDDLEKMPLLPRSIYDKDDFYSRSSEIPSRYNFMRRNDRKPFVNFNNNNNNGMSFYEPNPYMYGNMPYQFNRRRQNWGNPSFGRNGYDFFQYPSVSSYMDGSSMIDYGNPYVKYGEFSPKMKNYKNGRSTKNIPDLGNEFEMTKKGCKKFKKNQPTEFPKISKLLGDSSEKDGMNVRDIGVDTRANLKNIQNPNENEINLVEMRNQAIDSGLPDMKIQMKEEDKELHNMKIQNQGEEIVPLGVKMQNLGADSKPNLIKLQSQAGDSGLLNMPSMKMLSPDSNSANNLMKIQNPIGDNVTNFIKMQNQANDGGIPGMKVLSSDSEGTVNFTKVLNPSGDSATSFIKMQNSDSDNGINFIKIPGQVGGDAILPSMNMQIPDGSGLLGMNMQNQDDDNVINSIKMQNQVNDGGLPSIKMQSRVNESGLPGNMNVQIRGGDNGQGSVKMRSQIGDDRLYSLMQMQGGDGGLSVMKMQNQGGSGGSSGIQMQSLNNEGGLLGMKMQNVLEDSLQSNSKIQNCSNGNGIINNQLDENNKSVTKIENVLPTNVDNTNGNRNRKYKVVIVDNMSNLPGNIKMTDLQKPSISSSQGLNGVTSGMLSNLSTSNGVQQSIPRSYQITTNNSGLESKSQVPPMSFNVRKFN